MARELAISGVMTGAEGKYFISNAILERLSHEELVEIQSLLLEEARRRYLILEISEDRLHGRTIRWYPDPNRCLNGGELTSACYNIGACGCQVVQIDG